MSVRMSSYDAQDTITRFSCSNCWSAVAIYPAYDLAENGESIRLGGVVEVRCHTKGCNCSGFISKRTVEIRLADGWRMERAAREALVEAFPELNPDLKKKIVNSNGKTEAEFLKELGF
jgi:hypothetical protein